MADDRKKDLKRIEIDALQAITCLTKARTNPDMTSYNLRAIATLFEKVPERLREIADQMDKP